MPVLNSAPPPPRVTLEREEPGMWRLVRHGRPFAGPVLLLAGQVGWRFHVAGVGGDLSHRTFGHARAWLATGEGRAWLAALPTAEDPT